MFKPFFAPILPILPHPHTDIFFPPKIPVTCPTLVSEIIVNEINVINVANDLRHSPFILQKY